MPAKSQQQMKFIYAMRGKYGTKRKAPKNMKWVFDEEWTSGVKMKKLPKTIADKKKKMNESRIMDFGSFVNEKYEFEDFTMSDMEIVKELWEEGMTDIVQLGIECDLNKDTIKQIIYTLKKRGDIKMNENSTNEISDNPFVEFAEWLNDNMESRAGHWVWIEHPTIPNSISGYDNPKEYSNKEVYELYLSEKENPTGF